MNYTMITLVDITNTGVTHRDNDIFQRNQQRNWETVLQTIGMRAQPMEIQGPKLINGALDGLEFGEMYTGEHRVWIMNFSVEHSGIWEIGNDPTAGLEQDFNQVPIIVGLNETAKFLLPIFYSHGSIKNIYFKPTSFDLNIL